MIQHTIPNLFTAAFLIFGIFGIVELIRFFGTRLKGYGITLYRFLFSQCSEQLKLHIWIRGIIIILLSLVLIIEGIVLMFSKELLFAGVSSLLLFVPIAICVIAQYRFYAYIRHLLDLCVIISGYNTKIWCCFL